MFAAFAKFINVNVFGRILPKHLVIGATNGNGSVFVIEPKMLFVKIFGDGVVTIDEAEIFAGSFFETTISGGRLTTIFLVNDFDASILFGVIVGDFTRIVGGAVVDENDFEIFVRLIDERFDTFREIFSGIINWDYDGNFGTHFFLVSFFVVAFLAGVFSLPKTRRS